MAQVTDYVLTEEVKQWLDSEIADYQNPQHWEVAKEDGEGKIVWQKNLKAAGTIYPFFLRRLSVLECFCL